MTLDPIILIFEEFAHLDHRIEMLPVDGRGLFINDIVQRMWFAIREYVEENHPEVIP